MRQLNPPYPPFKDFEENYRFRVLVYQKGDSSTTDPSEADTDVFGNPIVLTEESKGSTVLSVFDSLPTMPCYDPSDINRLSAARLSRQSFAGNDSQLSVPTTYFDKFEAYDFAKRSCDSLVNNYNKFQDIVNNSPKDSESAS